LTLSVEIPRESVVKSSLAVLLCFREEILRKRVDVHINQSDYFLEIFENVSCFSTVLFNIFSSDGETISQADIFQAVRQFDKNESSSAIHRMFCECGVKHMNFHLKNFIEKSNLF